MFIINKPQRLAIRIAYSETICYTIIRLLSYFTCKMNMLFSYLHFAKIIKALLYPKRNIIGICSLLSNKKRSEDFFNHSFLL